MAVIDISLMTLNEMKIRKQSANNVEVVSQCDKPTERYHLSYLLPVL